MYSLSGSTDISLLFDARRLRPHPPFPVQLPALAAVRRVGVGTRQSQLCRARSPLPEYGFSTIVPPGVSAAVYTLTQ